MEGREIDISNFSAEQLEMLRKQMSEELQLINNSYATLKVASSRYSQSAEALVEFKPENKDKEVLVPLTSSMYIGGTISSINAVLVDIGTGYYVERTIPQAKKYLTGKVDMLAENLAKVAATMMQKRQDLEMVTYLLQQKLQAAQQPQAQASAIKPITADS